MKTEQEIRKMIAHQERMLEILIIQHSNLGQIDAQSGEGNQLRKEIARAEGRIEIMKKIIE